MKNAKCECGADVKWSWEQDVFFTNERPCVEIGCHNPGISKKTENDEIVIFCCRICGKAIGASYKNEDGIGIHSVMEYRNVDWGDDCNAC